MSQKRNFPQSLAVTLAFRLRSLKLRFFRSGTFVQAAFPLSYISTSSLRPLCSTAVTRFLATMGLSDSRQGPTTGYLFPVTVLPLRASQVPLPIFPRALPPLTPTSPTIACARYFIAGLTLAWLLAERAIYKISSFQNIRSARIILALPKSTKFRIDSQILPDLRALLRKFGWGQEMRLPRPSPPNVLIGGPVRIPPGFPLKACGNDGLIGELGVEGHTPFSFSVGEHKLMNHFVVKTP